MRIELSVQLIKYNVEISVIKKKFNFIQVAPFRIVKYTFDIIILNFTPRKNKRSI